MRLPPEITRQLDTIVLLFMLALFLMASPLLSWWAGEGSPWYLPYLIWSGIIALAAWLQIRRGNNDV